jgi:hypothetical protein
MSTTNTWLVCRNIIASRAVAITACVVESSTGAWYDKRSTSKVTLLRYVALITKEIGYT